MSRARRVLGGVAAAFCLLLPPPAGAELRVVEALGAVALHADAPPKEAPRDAAVARALLQGVRQVAHDELAVTVEDEALARALGRDPLAYATRYRILEDRGARPALFSDDPTAEREYVVVVEVHVDTGRVRNRLARAGLLAPSGEGEVRTVRLVLQDLPDHATYQAVRTLLEDLQVRALPVEFERGRAVLEVVGRRTPSGLLEALLRAAPPELRLVALGSDDRGAVLRAELVAPASDADEAPGPAARPFDTPDPNRY